MSDQPVRRPGPGRGGASDAPGTDEVSGRFRYLDSGSVEPLLPEARQAWLAATDLGLGDPRALHHPGRRAAQALDAARELAATLVGARPDEVVFAASGAAAAQWAIAGLTAGRSRSGAGVVVSAVEHSVVLDSADAYGDRRSVPVDTHGAIELDAWTTAVGAGDVAVACLQTANQEVGTRQPWTAAAAASAAAEVPLVTDAGATLGREPVPPGWTALVAGAHTFGGPASVGLLVLRRGARWRPPFPTDDYQDGRSLGTPDVPAVLAAVTALQVMTAEAERRDTVQRDLVDRLRSALATLPDVEVVGHPSDRVAHLLTCSALYVDGDSLVRELDKAGYAVASGSACSARSATPSHVLTAMGALTHGNLRIGLPRSVTAADVDGFVPAVATVVAQVRAELGAP